MSGEPSDYGSEAEDDDEGDEFGNDDEGSGGEDGSGASMFSDEQGVDVPLTEAETTPMTQEQKDERKKQKRIEKLEKRIKLMQKKKDKAPARREKYEKEASEIKNKHKRQEVVLRRKMLAHADAKLK